MQGAKQDPLSNRATLAAHTANINLGWVCRWAWPILPAGRVRAAAAGVIAATNDAHTPRYQDPLSNRATLAAHSANINVGWVSLGMAHLASRAGREPLQRR